VKIGSRYGRDHAQENKFPKDRILLEGNEFWVIFEKFLLLRAKSLNHEPLGRIMTLRIFFKILT
jgi:hypothetical protein